MTQDLMIPVIFLIIGIVLIDYFENILPVFVLGLLYIPIAWLFTYQVTNGLYVNMFDTSITGYASNLPYFNSVLSGTMFAVPISAFAKTMYLRYFVSNKEGETDNYAL